ncbi:hypothetical protein GPECTOR_4g894 [Gonium pectorale]|uniref:Uncharacterized protein n=1 Tax=Gonium pectorale TaxID=33097 RepID=A0A150GYI8_GONPE|nr:hypothetical protein GPECTOR_4g894 [Gonium pectorale]|eukprot:KXZ54823.1 hypothetical protein GPECTOR_4g894 [Gonium pectorale]
MSRTAVRLERAASKLVAGSASMRKPRHQPRHQTAAAAVAPILLAHFAAACALSPTSSEQHDETPYPSPRGVDEAAVAQWAVNTLGLQSSML